MANKKKKQQSQCKKGSAPQQASRDKKEKAEPSNEEGASTSTTTTTTTAAGVRKPFSHCQLTALCFLSMGMSRVFEWKRAVHEITERTERHQNGTGICQEYLLTNDTVDYDSICDTSLAATLVQYKYDTSVQLISMVFWLVILCWQDEPYFAKLNTLLSLTPISTTLLLLQACAPWIEKTKSNHLTITCAVLMAVSTGTSISTIRDFLLGGGASGTKMPPRGSIQSTVLSAMVFVNGYEVYQWYQTAISHGSAGVLSSTLASNWNDAFQVFFFSILLDKFTITLLLAFVWFGLPEGRQRRFLLAWTIIQGAMVHFRYSKYNEADFADLSTMKNAALACSVLSGMAWLAPTMSSVTNNKPKAS